MYRFVFIDRSGYALRPVQLWFVLLEIDLA